MRNSILFYIAIVNTILALVVIHQTGGILSLIGTLVGAGLGLLIVKWERHIRDKIEKRCSEWDEKHLYTVTPEMDHKLAVYAAGKKKQQDRLNGEQSW